MKFILSYFELVKKGTVGLIGYCVFTKVYMGYVSLLFMLDSREIWEMLFISKIKVSSKQYYVFRK